MAYRILIVDDENALQDMVREILTQAGYETDAALSCAQAVERFRIGNPDAVLLDVNLPDGDGFSLFGKLREGRDVRCCSSPPGTRTRTGSAGWASGQTTTSQSPSCPRSCCSGCAPCCGGSTAKRRTRRGSGTRKSTGARASCAATAWRPP